MAGAVLEASAAERLIAEIAKTAVFLPPPTHNRMRVAVSEDEYEAIREHCFKRDGYFSGRIRNIPLVIEENPLNPAVRVEGAPDASGNGR